MTVYRKIIGTDAWHWMKTCKHWPGNSFDQQILKDGFRPEGGELCDECRAKEKLTTKKRNKWKKRERA